MTEKAQKVNAFIAALFLRMDLPKGEAISRLRDSMNYSATNGGKRFRPVLSLLVGDVFGCDEQKILPFACAVEFIHTYSLIHDDLPCMDNDDLRRGKPTNHKVYGEAVALLAGDSLLTEAFLILTEAYRENGFLLGRLIELLSTAAGLRGMIGGQALDMAAQKMTLPEMTQMHRLKTGCLIQLAVEGAAQIAGAKPSEIESLKKFGEQLGLAFQVADDLLDHREKDQEEKSFVSLLGVQGTRDYLKKTSDGALMYLRQVSQTAIGLEYLIHFNQNRQS
jgi:geranylgeranyl diphosphate synthase type II